jgi:hypothetical protein
MMGEFFSKLVDIFVHSNKAVFFRLLLLICLAVIGLPMGLNYFYGNIKLEQEIRLLKELNSINPNDIEDERLRNYYDDIIVSITNKRPLNISFIVNNKVERNFFELRNMLKFISGSFWWLLLFIVGLFIKQNTIGSKIGVQIIFLILIIIFGYIGVIIPTIDPIIINIICFPILQIIVIIIVGVIINKINTKSKLSA